jgi:hypothetical protein
MREALDWDRFLALAWRHWVMPLVYRHLLNSFAELVPPRHLQKIHDEYQHNSARNLLLVNELCGVLDDLESQGIAAIPYKGPALALQVYGDLKLRSFGDLDVLVRRRDAAHAGTLLTAHGYRPHIHLSPVQEAMAAHSKCDRVYFREGRNVMLELHWAIVPRYFSIAIETEAVIADSANAEMCGRKVIVPSPEMLVLLLCVNGAKDLWKTLDPVCSINELVRRYPGLDWARVLTLGRSVSAIRILHVGLLLTHEIFDLPLPAWILASIAADLPAKNMVSEARTRLSETELPAPGLIETARFQIRSRERGRDKLRYCAWRLFTPSYEDCSPELPASFSFLYYVLRPLRLIRQALKSGARTTL